MKHTLFAAALAVAAAPAFADSWSQIKEAAKQQAAQKAEEELNLPQAAAQGARVYFLAPANNAEVKSPFKVVFGLENMGVAPAGTNMEGTGHHHLLIDDPQIVYTQPLPATDQVKHFGKGQTETVLDLKPGKHTLQLLLGDWKHQAHNPALLSEKITVTVTK